MPAFVSENATLLLRIVSTLIWAASLWTVFGKGKFKRKWLWVLLTLLSFGWTFELDGRPMEVIVPLGSLYVLLFAVVGPRSRPKAAPLDLNA